MDRIDKTDNSYMRVSRISQPGGVYVSSNGDIAIDGPFAERQEEEKTIRIRPVEDDAIKDLFTLKTLHNWRAGINGEVCFGAYSPFKGFDKYGNVVRVLKKDTIKDPILYSIAMPIESLIVGDVIISMENPSLVMRVLRKDTGKDQKQISVVNTDGVKMNIEVPICPYTGARLVRLVLNPFADIMNGEYKFKKDMASVLGDLNFLQTLGSNRGQSNGKGKINPPILSARVIGCLKERKIDKELQGKIINSFIGKGGDDDGVSLTDLALSRILGACQEEENEEDGTRIMDFILVKAIASKGCKDE